MKESTLYKKITSDENLFNAIYSLESYVFEKELLDDDDLEMYNKLSDKYNKPLIDETIKECRNLIIELIDNNNLLLTTTVYFKPKKINPDTNGVEFRPIHTARLKTQICIVAMLTPLIFDDSSGKRKLSEISRTLPSNYYGNIPSTDVIHLFKPWANQYKTYSESAIKAQRDYCDTKKYVNEVNLDIKKFFPSINPKWIYNLILSKHPISYSENDIECLKIVLEKLLFFNLNITNDALLEYYPQNDFQTIKQTKILHNIGIAQGLPQAYFFGNLCMTLISSEIENIFNGDAYYYVDDSIIYTNSLKESFASNIKKLNKNINKRLKDLSNENDFESIAIKEFNENIEYNIEIYDAESKSSICEIKSNFSLFLFSKPASSTPFEIFASLDELEDASLKQKMESILNFIEYRLTELESDKSTKKLLLRYKKFYTNRLNTLKEREENEKNEINLDNFYVKYGLKENDTIETFINALEDNVFIVESKLFIKQLSINRELQEDIVKRLKEFEKRIYHGEIKHYFSKVLTNYAKRLQFKDRRYKSIEYEIDSKIENFYKVESKKKIDSINKTLESLRNLGVIEN